MNKNPEKTQPSLSIYRLIKEFIRISRLSISPIPGKILARNWLALQMSGRKHEKPFVDKIGNSTLYAASHYDFLELFDEVFLVNAYHTRLDEPQPVILDCGSNCGFVTAYFKMLHPESKIIAFEPNPNVFSLLKKNIETNNWANVTAINAACGTESREVEFSINESYSLAGSAVSNSGSGQIRVQQVALADFITERISLLKMDIEGAETAVLHHLSETGKIRMVKRFAIEYHHRLFDEKSKLADFLKVLEENDFDYNFFAYRTHPEFYSPRWQSMMIYAFKK